VAMKVCTQHRGKAECVLVVSTTWNSVKGKNPWCLLNKTVVVITDTNVVPLSGIIS
jgi:hypothetical protein